MNDGGHLAYVEVHADKKWFSRLLFICAVVVLSIELVVNSAACQVGELAAQVSFDQLFRIGTQQRRNVVRRQVLRIIECTGLRQSIQRGQFRLIAHRLHELLINELEALRRRRYINAVSQIGHVIAHTSDDFTPCLLSFSRWHDVQFIHQSVANLETDYRGRLFH